MHLIKNVLLAVCTASIVLTAGTSDAAQKQIPTNAPHWGHSRYAIYTYSGDSFTWEQAERYCENMGGHLVTITSPQEQAFIEQLNSENRHLWIGAYRPEGTSFA